MTADEREKLENDMRNAASETLEKIDSQEDYDGDGVLHNDEPEENSGLQNIPVINEAETIFDQMSNEQLIDYFFGDSIDEQAPEQIDDRYGALEYMNAPEPTAPVPEIATDSAGVEKIPEPQNN